MKAICNMYEKCIYANECHHSKSHEYMAAICREQYCSMTRELCKCNIWVKLSRKIINQPNFDRS